MSTQKSPWSHRDSEDDNPTSPMVPIKKRRILPRNRNCSPLPNDILAHIWSFLDVTALKSLRLTCKRWNLVALDRCRSSLTYTVRYLEIEGIEDDATQVLLRTTWDNGQPHKLFHCPVENLSNMLSRTTIKQPVDDKNAHTWCVLNLLSGGRQTGQRILDDFSHCNLMPDSLHIYGLDVDKAYLNFTPAINRYHRNKLELPHAPHKLFLRMVGHSHTPPITFGDEILAPHLTALCPIDSVRLHFTLDAVIAWLHNDTRHARELTVAVGWKTINNAPTLNEHDIVQLAVVWQQTATETEKGGKLEKWPDSRVRFKFEGFIFHSDSWMEALSDLKAMFEDTDGFTFRESAFHDIMMHVQIGKLTLECRFLS